jgi:hypothetical protein
MIYIRWNTKGNSSGQRKIILGGIMNFQKEMKSMRKKIIKIINAHTQTHINVYIYREREI